MENFNVEKQAEDEDLDWARHQYSTPDSSVLEAFLANFVNIQVQSEEVEPSYPESITF